MILKDGSTLKHLMKRYLCRSVDDCVGDIKKPKSHHVTYYVNELRQ